MVFFARFHAKKLLKFQLQTGSIFTEFVLLKTQIQLSRFKKKKPLGIGIIVLLCRSHLTSCVSVARWLLKGLKNKEKAYVLS